MIERIFGVLKRRFRILLLPPEYDLDIAANIPLALAAIHNIIRRLNPQELDTLDDDFVPGVTDYEPRDTEPYDNDTDLSKGPPTAVDRSDAEKYRDALAWDMWLDYLDVLETRKNAAEEAARAAQIRHH